MQRFERLFLGYENAYGTYEIFGTKTEKGKVEGKGITLLRGANTNDYAQHLSGENGIGLIPLRADNTCYFSAIDIDIYDVDHQRLQKDITKRKLPLVLCRTKSAGAHLYLFCKEAIDAQIIREKLISWSMLLGFAGSEIFPKQTYRLKDNDIGNWINIPYFQHDATERYAFDEGGRKLSFKEFLDFAESKMVDLLALKGATSKIGEDHDKTLFAGGPPCLKKIFDVGGFPEGTRNNGMYNVGVYLKKRYPDDWEKKIEEYNRSVCSPGLDAGELKTLAKSLSRKDYFYTCKQSPICELCNKTACLKQPYGIGDKSETAAIGIEIDNLTKHDGEPVFWIVNMNEKRIQFTTEELCNQALFSKKCMEHINYLPPTVTKKKWEDYINEKLAAMKPEDIIHVPKEASAKGQFFEIFNQFCNNRVQAKSKEELLSNKPWRHDGKIQFTGRSLFEFLQTKRFAYKSEHAVWQMLREAGAEKSFDNIKGVGVNSWIMPAPEMETEVEEKLDFKGEDF